MKFKLVPGTHTIIFNVSDQYSFQHSEQNWKRNADFSHIYCVGELDIRKWWMSAHHSGQTTPNVKVIQVVSAGWSIRDVMVVLLLCAWYSFTYLRKYHPPIVVCVLCLGRNSSTEVNIDLSWECWIQPLYMCERERNGMLASCSFFNSTECQQHNFLCTLCSPKLILRDYNQQWGVTVSFLASNISLDLQIYISSCQLLWYRTFK